MLRVVMLQVSALLGGSDRSLLDLLRAGHRKLFDATVVLPKAGPLCSHLETVGVRYVIVDQPVALLRQSRSLRLASIPDLIALPLVVGPYLVRLSAAIRRLRPDVVYTNGIKAHVLSALVCSGRRVGTVWHMREHWGGRLVGRLADACPERVIANSQSTANRLQKFMRRPGKVVVIHNAVDTDEFSPEGPVAEIEAVQAGTLRIGLVGTLVRLKGHKLLLRAMQRVRSEFPSVRCFFVGGAIYDTVGDRAYEAELRRHVDEEGMGGCVVFTGFQRDMAPWYRAMDIVVSASTQPEGFGRTLLEAMACGIPVIGPNAGGIPEFVRQGENGLLYEMGNADGLGAAILTLLRGPALRRRLGAAGRETALQRFSPAGHSAAIWRVLSRGASRSTLSRARERRHAD